MLTCWRPLELQGGKQASPWDRSPSRPAARVQAPKLPPKRVVFWPAICNVCYVAHDSPAVCCPMFSGWEQATSKKKGLVQGGLIMTH